MKKHQIMKAPTAPRGNRNAAVKDLTVLELRFSGFTLSQIAGRLKVSRSLIVTRLKRLRDPQYVKERDAAYYATNRHRIKVKRVLK
jgi:Mn-dependent DtxR family transcriptional regulator